jgi:hypothetical protein
MANPEMVRTSAKTNHTLFGGAFKALCSGRTNRGWLSFPDSFSLVHFFWRSKRNEQIMVSEFNNLFNPVIFKVLLKNNLYIPVVD